MSAIGRLYRAETSISFVGQARRWFIVSGIAIAICLLSLAIRNLNLSLDFTGGTSISMPNPASAGVGEIRSALGSVGAAARVQLVDDGASVRIQTEAVDLDTERAMVLSLVEVTGTGIELTDVESVGPTFGRQIAGRAVQALLVFLGVVVVFISIRFEWKMALGAIAALLHDLILTAGAYSLVGFEVTPATVVAVLTILGYSLYDTVVVYDKIKENVESDQDRRTYTYLVDRSMNQVLMRSINTSLTSLLPVGSLLFIGSLLLGAGTLRDFALALFVGIAAGTYSSIFVAAPLLALWKERETEWSRRRYRSERKAGGSGASGHRLSSRGQSVARRRKR
ncbi:MAG: protein translocase subunit SecF [Acidimicrobiia bacterium]|nr:protein translocase subunit SecF [Acidimicrobiia bacterium]